MVAVGVRADANPDPVPGPGLKSPRLPWLPKGPEKLTFQTGEDHGHAKRFAQARDALLQRFNKYAAISIIVGLLFLIAGIAASDQHVLSPAAAQALIQDNKDNPKFIILDVRTKDEYDKGHIEGARSMNYYATNFVRMATQLTAKRRFSSIARKAGRARRPSGRSRRTGIRSSTFWTAAFRSGSRQACRWCGRTDRIRRDGVPGWPST